MRGWRETRWIKWWRVTFHFASSCPWINNWHLQFLPSWNFEGGSGVGMGEGELGSFWVGLAFYSGRLAIPQIATYKPVIKRKTPELTILRKSNLRINFQEAFAQHLSWRMFFSRLLYRHGKRTSQNWLFSALPVRRVGVECSVARHTHHRSHSCEGLDAQLFHCRCFCLQSFPVLLSGVQELRHLKRLLGPRRDDRY